MRGLWIDQAQVPLGELVREKEHGNIQVQGLIKGGGIEIGGVIKTMTKMTPYSS